MARMLPAIGRNGYNRRGTWKALEKVQRALEGSKRMTAGRFWTERSGKMVQIEISAGRIRISAGGEEARHALEDAMKESKKKKLTNEDTIADITTTLKERGFSVLYGGGKMHITSPGSLYARTSMPPEVIKENILAIMRDRFHKIVTERSTSTAFKELNNFFSLRNTYPERYAKLAEELQRNTGIKDLDPTKLVLNYLINEGLGRDVSEALERVGKLNIAKRHVGGAKKDALVRTNMKEMTKAVLLIASEAGDMRKRENAEHLDDMDITNIVIPSKTITHNDGVKTEHPDFKIDEETMQRQGIRIYRYLEGLKAKDSRYGVDVLDLLVDLSTLWKYMGKSPLAYIFERDIIVNDFCAIKNKEERLLLADRIQSILDMPLDVFIKKMDLHCVNELRQTYDIT